MDINQDGSIEWTEFRNFLSQEVRLHAISRRCTSLSKRAVLLHKKPDWWQLPLSDGRWRLGLCMIYNTTPVYYCLTSWIMTGTRSPSVALCVLLHSEVPLVQLDSEIQQPCLFVPLSLVGFCSPQTTLPPR